jgi:hypothetical protein
MPMPPVPDLVLGPWVAGLVNSVDEWSIPKDGLLTADNVDIDRSGRVESRHKWDLLDSANYTSIYELNGITYAVRNSFVGIVGASTFTALASVAGPIAWTSLSGKPVYTDFETVRIIEGEIVSALPSGYYQGEEEDQYQLQLLPGGSEIHYWQGRLLIVRGNSLIWSEPLRYGVYSEARNKYPLGERITWIAPIESGIFVGLRKKVVFLRGTNPEEFNRRTVSGPSAPGVAAVYDTRHRGEGAGEVALWLSDVGIAIGQPSGTVVYPQAKRLNNIPLLPGKMFIEGDRVFVLTTQEH